MKVSKHYEKVNYYITNYEILLCSIAWEQLQCHIDYYLQVRDVEKNGNDVCINVCWECAIFAIQTDYERQFTLKRFAC